jgi:hypothetical protein
VNAKKIVTVETCLKCGHSVTDEMDLSVKEEKPDPYFAKDRVRFCLSKEEYDKKREDKWRADNMANEGKQREEWEKKEKDFAAISKIKKLTITDLEKLFVPICEKAGYARFLLGAPHMGRDLSVPFTVQETKSDRAEHIGTKELKKLVQTELEGTNWRLMSDGISYRLGILSGHLRAYEREEDLLKLIHQKLKKAPK